MRARHRTMIAAGLLIGSVPVAAQGRRPAAPVRQPQVAGIAPAPATPPRDAPLGPPMGNTGYRLPPPSAESIYGWVPAVIGRDGRVWVDLGYGFEPVVRSCDAAYRGDGYGYGYSEGTSSQPTYTTPTYTAPTYTAPTYSAPTYGTGSMTGSAPASQPAPAPASSPQSSGGSTYAPAGGNVAGIAPAPSTGMTTADGRTIQYSFPPRDHRAVASCYVSVPRGRPAVMWR